MRIDYYNIENLTLRGAVSGVLQKRIRKFALICKPQEAAWRIIMNKVVKGAVTAATATGIALCSPTNYVIAQAPTQTILPVSAGLEKVSSAEVELLPNPVLKQNQEMEESVPAFSVQDVAWQKIEALAESRAQREKEERIQEEKLRKKRLLEKKKRQEAKRRKEIKACCGVSAGMEDCRILERIVEAEAGGENFTGKVLVANVVLNRVKSKAFPSTIKGVVFAHRGSRYQFSPISDGRYYTVKVSKHTKKAVQAALNGKNPSRGALYFMERASASKSNVSWFDRALTRLFRYGCHEFFK